MIYFESHRFQDEIIRFAGQGVKQSSFGNAVLDSLLQIGRFPPHAADDIDEVGGLDSAFNIILEFAVGDEIIYHMTLYFLKPPLGASLQEIVYRLE